MSASPPPRRFLPLGGFADAFWWGLTRVVRWKKVVVVAACAIGMGIFIGTLVRKAGAAEAAETLSRVLNQGVLAFGLPVLALLLAGEGFAYEVEAKTLVYHLVRPIRRTTLFFARFLAGFVPAALVAAIAIAGVVVASGVPFTPRAWLMIPAVAGLGVFTLSAIYYTLGALFKNGFVVGLIYTFFVEAALSSVPGSLQQYSVTHHIRGLARYLTEGVLPYAAPKVDNPFFSERLLKTLNTPPDPTQATIHLLAMAGIVLIVGAWWTARRDFALK